MTGNTGRKYSGVTLMVSGTLVMSLHDGTKGACRHVGTPTLKSVMELRKSL